MPDQTTADTIGHGTAIASIIAGSDAAGIMGLCPEVNLVPLVYYGKGNDNGIVKGDCALLARIIVDAVDIYGCRIINISSGARVDSAELRIAVAWAEKKGALIISSAGNDGNDTYYYPSAYENVMCVGSANESHSGHADFSNCHESVDLLAPGEKLQAATIKGNRFLASGTSFSTAYIAGVAAKLLTEYPYLSTAQVRQILFASATEVEFFEYSMNSCWGIVTLDKALACARRYNLFRIWKKHKNNLKMKHLS